MQKPPIKFIDDRLQGQAVKKKIASIGDLKDIFGDEELRADLPQDKPVYEVDAYLPVSETTIGGLFFGVTRIRPGKIGNEYYMTRGHFHSIPDRAEFYWGISGSGMLILMDRQRNTYAEPMEPGSLHYIPAHTAHRVANTGDTILSFGACWPADAGHDYKEIEDHGFSARLMQVNGTPELVKNSR